MDPVQEMHNAAARSTSAAEASVRPTNTSDAQLARIVGHIKRILDVSSDTSVLDIGCGTGVIGLPLARVATSYLGVDYASEAVAVLSERIEEAGISDRARGRVVDILSEDSPPRFGTFDRVVVYAAAHFVRSDDEGVRFISTALENLAVGGQGLIGSLPLADLRADWPAAEPVPAGAVRRRAAFLGWMARRGRSRVPLTRTWKFRFVALSLARSLSTALRTGRAPVEEAPAIAPGYLIELTTARVEQWVRETGIPVELSWRLPPPSESLVVGRADLLLKRSAPPT